MRESVPRIIVAGVGSGCGKTTVTCALMRALTARGLKVGAFKCGPDYIDTMFHTQITQNQSANLDSFFFPENTLKYLLAKNSAGCDISVIEGVMGFYDGICSTQKSSTHDISAITNSPVVLVVSAKGMSTSLLAIVHGFLSLYPENNICGVILNNCTHGTYSAIRPAFSAHFGERIKLLGYMPTLKDCALESRHLGLKCASEVNELEKKLSHLAAQAEESVDIDGILSLSKSAPAVEYEPISFPAPTEKVRIAVARDKAFCFYYKDNLDVLREMGAELVFFSPIEDSALPADIHGIYLSGGYPELCARDLSKNQSMRASLKTALERHIPCIAECGAFMYLGESIGEYPMVGYLPGKSFDTGALCRFGYITLTAKEDNMLCRKGEEIPAHEFHYWDSSDAGNCFSAKKASGKTWDCAVATDCLYAGYPHFNFYANPSFAVNFYNACVKEKLRHA